MRIKSESLKTKRDRLEKWHPFYPWWPRRIGNTLVCFEWIERRFIPPKTYMSDYEKVYRYPLGEKECLDEQI